MPRRSARVGGLLAAALTAAVAWPAAGRADTRLLASDPVLGGGHQASIYCTFTNTGPSPITLSDYAIVVQAGPVPLFYDMCAHPLAPGGDCQFAATTETAAVCRATAISTGPTSGLRGVVDARNTRLELLWSAPVH